MPVATGILFALAAGMAYQGFEMAIRAAALSGSVQAAVLLLLRYRQAFAMPLLLLGSLVVALRDNPSLWSGQAGISLTFHLPNVHWPEGGLEIWTLGAVVIAMP